MTESIRRLGHFFGVHILVILSKKLEDSYYSFLLKPMAFPKT